MVMTLAEALGTPAQVGPRVVQKAFYGGLAGACAASWWWGFSVASLALGFLGGLAAGAVAGIALVLLDAFVTVMISRK